MLKASNEKFILQYLLWYVTSSLIWITTWFNCQGHWESILTRIIMRNTILGEGLRNFGLCSTLMAIEHWWNFSVLYMYMIWHGASFYKVLTQWPLHLVAFYNKPGVLMTFYNPVQHRIRYNCIKHTYDTYSLFVSFFTIPRVQGMVVFRYSLNKCFCHSLFIFYLLLWNIYSGKITHKGKSYLVAYIIVFLLYRLYVVNQIGFALFLLTKFHCFIGNQIVSSYLA